MAGRHRVHTLHSMHYVVAAIACVALLSGCQLCVTDRCGNHSEGSVYPSGGTSPPTPPPWTAFNGAECVPAPPAEVDDRLTCAGLRPGAPWPTHGRCGDRVSSTTLVAAPPTKVRWSYMTGPISLDVDDVAYAVQGPRLVAFASDGESLWASDSFEIPEAAKVPPTIAPDGTLYAIGSTRVHAVCPGGRRRWSVNVASAGAAALTNGTVIVSGSFADAWGLFAIDRNGQKAWSGTGYAIAEPTVTGSGLVLAVAENTLFAMRSNAELAWKAPLTSGGAVAAVGPDGPVLLEVNDKSELVVVARTGDGALRWSHGTGGRRVSGVSIGADGTTLITTEHLPAGEEPAQLLSLSSDGSERFHLDLEGSFVGPALVDGAGSAIVVDGKRVVAFDAHGTVMWSFALQAAPPYTNYAELRAILGTKGLYVTGPGYTVALDH